VLPDQDAARIFYQSGWTQEELAAFVGKSRSYCARRLLFGRFLGFVPDRHISRNDTEWRFRSFWERTQGTNERQRFTHVLRLMDEDAQPAPAIPDAKAPKVPLGKRIIEHFGDAASPASPSSTHGSAGALHPQGRASRVWAKPPSRRVVQDLDDGSQGSPLWAKSAIDTIWSSEPQLVIKRHPALFIVQPSLGFPPSDLPHGLDLPRRKVEPRLRLAVSACPRPEAQSPLTVNLGALGKPWGCGARAKERHPHPGRRGFAVGLGIHRHGEGCPGFPVSGGAHFGIFADAAGEGGVDAVHGSFSMGSTVAMGCVTSSRGAPSGP